MSPLFEINHNNGLADRLQELELSPEVSFMIAHWYSEEVASIKNHWAELFPVFNSLVACIHDAWEKGDDDSLIGEVEIIRDADKWTNSISKEIETLRQRSPIPA